MTAVATLPDIDKLVAGYDHSLELFTDAFGKIAEADTAIAKAMATMEAVTPGAAFHSHNDAREVGEFFNAVKLPDRAVYLRTARKLMTLRGWHYVIDRCGMRQLMDAQAKKEFDAQLRYVPERSRGDRELITEDEADKGPPPFTAENIRATIERFSADSQMIWRRGIANVFSQLDRRFRSHDGFKIGSRVILNSMVNSWGHLDTYGERGDRFRDIERTFKILDGADPRHAQSNFLSQVGNERRSHNPHQSEHEHPYFKLRIFKNGNAHLWFTRDDLVEKVNKELAAYYGEVLGDGMPDDEPDPLKSTAVTHARNFGFFPTPPEIAERLFVHVPYSKTPRRILEPSAGTGNLAYLAGKPREVEVNTGRTDEDGYDVHERRTIMDTVDAIEVQPDLVAQLRNACKLANVQCANFLTVEPKPIYDGVIMNPPFDKQRDIDHVVHALKFLKPDGFLLAIMSAGVEFRENAKAAAFRKLLDERKGWIIDLPDGAFAPVGTYVNTVLVGINTGRRPWRFGST